ncbi:hypothetical protein GH742_13985 [Legionella sp. MW5194]|uniref:hypothetical protein n=1 Tax=Legionella sp. MW5194 TaxID=2662448 RepID=UPI00193CA0A7|nr:hypothetical protein [Legionella sp. MW5194]QRN04877.1 hypothetical protein GH742_13985 [Legionella sp. MW5194]
MKSTFDKFLDFFKKKKNPKPKAFSADNTPHRLSLAEANTPVEKVNNRPKIHTFSEQQPHSYSVCAVRITSGRLGVKIEFEIKPEALSKVYFRLTQTKIPLKCNKHNEAYHLALTLSQNRYIQIVTNDMYDILKSLEILSPEYLSPELLQQIVQHFPAVSGEIDLYSFLPPPLDEAPEPPQAGNTPLQTNASSSAFFIVRPVKQAPNPPENQPLKYQ